MLPEPKNHKVTVDYAAKEKRETARQNRGQYVDNSSTCYCCGRKAGSHWVALDLRTGDAVTIEYALAEEGMDTAFFPVGPTCRKTLGIPATHVATRKKLFG